MRVTKRATWKYTKTLKMLRIVVVLTDLAMELAKENWLYSWSLKWNRTRYYLFYQKWKKKKGLLARIVKLLKWSEQIKKCFTPFIMFGDWWSFCFCFFFFFFYFCLCFYNLIILLSIIYFSKQHMVLGPWLQPLLYRII